MSDRDCLECIGRIVYVFDHLEELKRPRFRFNVNRSEEIRSLAGVAEFKLNQTENMTSKDRRRADLKSLKWFYENTRDLIERQEAEIYGRRSYNR